MYYRTNRTFKNKNLLTQHIEVALRGTIKSSIMNFYKRNLPHWQPQGAEYFVTFRLEGSLPRKVVEQLTKKRNLLKKAAKKDGPKTEASKQRAIQQKIFQKYEHILDKGETGPTWLSNEAVAEIVKEALHHRNQSQYDLYTFCIMSNHIHLVFKLLTDLTQKNT